MQGGKLGQVTYSGCLTIHSSAEELHLSVLLPFRPGHPPVFIPWDAVYNATVKKVLWSRRVVFEAGSSEGTCC